MKLELNEQEAQALTNLMDAGLKNNELGGLRYAGIAAMVIERLNASVREQGNGVAKDVPALEPEADQSAAD